MSRFEKIDTKDLDANFFEQIGKNWMLLSAGKENSFNTMTASWGGVGILWNKDVSFVFIRPSRYTLEFVESNDHYSLSFFGGNYKKELSFCGTRSGRDTDKIKETGLTPVFDYDTVFFDEAELVVVCKKLYRQKMEESSFIDRSLIDKFYNGDGLHEIFIGEIVSVLKKTP